MERMNPMNGTSIVILNYNTRDFLDTCLQSIRANTRDVPHEVIVVDNGSKDGSVKWLKQQKDIRCIFNKKNEGFPKGCNQGLAIARGTELLLLNSDTIVTPRWLSNMRTALYSRDNVGAVGCMTNYCSNFQQVNDAGYKSVDELMTFAEKYNRSDPAKWERRLRLVGFCFLFRRDIYEKLGGLDEQFSPGNYEDDDYSLRIWQAGYELLLCRDTFIHHFGSGSFVEDETAEVREKKRQAYHALLKRNGEKFIEKWNVPYNYKELGLRDIFPDWQGPEVVRCIDLQADFLRRQKALEKKMAHAGELQRPVHDLPVLYFSSDRKDVEPHDLEMVNFCDHDAGPVAFETGIEGLRLDFRAGVRLRVPKGPWHVRIGDAETGLWFFDGDVSGTVLVSMEKYAIRWQIEVYRDGEFVFSHTFDPTGLNVFFDLSETPLGTSLMFLPYIEAYQRETGCHAVCRVKEQMKPILWRYCSDLALADAIGADDYAVCMCLGTRQGSHARSPRCQNSGPCRRMSRPRGRAPGAMSASPCRRRACRSAGCIQAAGMLSSQHSRPMATACSALTAIERWRRMATAFRFLREPRISRAPVRSRNASTCSRALRASSAGRAVFRGSRASQDAPSCSSAD